MNTASRKLFKCIEVLSKAPPGGLAVGELGSLTGFTWQSSSRLLAVLEEDGLVIKDPVSKKYRMSLRLCELANSILLSSTPINVAQNELTRLALDTGRRCDLLVLEGLDAVIVERCDPVEGLPVHRMVLGRQLWYENAAGMAIVAFSSEDAIRAILERTLLAGELTPPPREDLVRDLMTVQTQGFALSPHVRPGGLMGIVVPVLDRSGWAAAGIGVRVATRELESEEGEALISQMHRSAELISRYLGFEDESPTRR